MRVRRSRVVLPLAVASIVLVPLGAIAVAAPTHGSAGAIHSVAPRVERAGRTAVITGSGFRHVRAVRFHGRAAHFRVVSSRRIRARVPATATSGRVTVDTAAGILTSRKPLRVAPTLTSFTPTSGGVHTVVTLTGTGFTTPASVSFNGSSVTGTVVSATSITASLPAAATTGPVKLTTAGSTLTGGTFTVTAGLALSTTVGPPTTSISVYGTGFGAREAVDLYAGTTDVALVSANSVGSFAYTGFGVPSAVRPGALQITAIGRHSGTSAQTPFTVRTDWPQLSGGANRTGVNNTENVLTNSTVSSLDTKWAFHTSSNSISAPAVVGGVIYCVDFDGDVYAVNAVTGVQIWTHALGQIAESSPAVIGTTLYVGDTDGSLYALNTATGATRWTYAAGGGIYSSPAVANGLVYFGTFDNTKVIALNAATGVPVWSVSTDQGVVASPAVAGGRVFVGTYSGKLYAFDATDGAVDWSVSTGNENIVSSASVVAGTVYVGVNDDTMRAYAAASGDLRWTYTTGGTVVSTPAVADNTVYFGSSDGTVYAVNATSGILVWSYATTGEVDGSAIFANGIVYAGSDGGNVYALNASSGGVLGQVTVGDQRNSPVIADGRLIVASDVLYDFEPTFSPDAANARPAISQLHPNMQLRVTS